MLIFFSFCSACVGACGNDARERCFLDMSGLFLESCQFTTFCDKSTATCVRSKEEGKECVGQYTLFSNECGDNFFGDSFVCAGGEEARCIRAQGESE